MQQAAQHLLRGLLTAALTTLVLLCGGPFSSTAQGQTSPNHRGNPQASSPTQRGSALAGSAQAGSFHAYGDAAVSAKPPPGQPHRLPHSHGPGHVADALVLPARAVCSRGTRTSSGATRTAQHTTRSGRAPPT